MIEIKRNVSSSKQDNLSKLTYTFGNYTIRFTDEEYRALTDILADSQEKPEDILRTLIEDGLYLMIRDW